MSPKRKKKTCILIAALAAITFRYSLWHHFSTDNNPRFWNAKEILRRGYKGLPFPVENTGRLPTAYSTVTSCKKKPKYLFFIHTAPEHIQHRTLLRSFLGNTNFSTLFEWTTVFFVGLSRDGATPKLLEEEVSQHGDVVVLPYVDVYKNLTYKFVYGIKWAIENCPSVKYVVKMDDDFVINVLNVMNYLEKLPKAQGPELHCNVYKHGKVERDKKSKWYLSENAYPNKTFPPYCAGGCTIFSASALKKLYSASFLLPFHGIDDVYVTGQAAQIVGVKLIELNKQFSFFSDDWSEVTSGKVMFSQIRNHERRAKAWRTIYESVATSINTTSANNKTR